MSYPTITALPAAPLRSAASEDDYVNVADTWAAALDPWTDAINAAGEWTEEQLAVIEGIVLNTGFTATSTTSMAIGTGSRSFTIQTGLGWRPGMFAVLADAAAPSTNYMLVQVESYDAGTGATVVNAFAGAGSGTKTSWSFVITGPGREVNAPVTASVSGSYTPNFAPASGFSSAVNFVWTLTGNLFLNAPTGAVDGQSGVIYFIQNATGGWTLSLATAINTPSSSTPTLPTTPNSVSRCGYFIRGTIMELTFLEQDFG